MAESIKLSVEIRENKHKNEARDLRKEGYVPGVIYGRGKDPVSIKIPYLAFEKAYNAAGENTLLDLVVGDRDSQKALIYNADLNPVTDRFDHVDFYRIDMNKEIDTEIPIKLTGVSPCVSDDGGMLIQPLDEVEVRCLPGDLISEIEVDISSLEKFNDSIHVGELNVSDKVKLLTPENVMVVQVVEPKEEVIPEAAPEMEAVVVEGEEGEAKEGEEAAKEGEGAAKEGEAPAKEAGSEEKPEEKK